MIKINFKHELLLTNRQVANLHKAFANYLSTDTKLSKTVSKMIQSGGIHGSLFGPLLKTGLPLMKNVTKPLAKSALFPLGLTAAASVADAGIHKILLGFGHSLDSGSHTTTPIISNDEMEDIMKIVKSLEDSGLLLKRVQNKVNEQKGGFLSMFLGTVGASLLGNMLAAKGINRAGEAFIRAGYGSRRSSIKDF